LEAAEMSYVDEIGSTAGTVWGFLVRSGPASLSAVEKGVDAPRQLVAMAIGWLAREGKVAVDREQRSIRIRLL
jgi:Winged helix-turn-helix domain (DUF2582)